MNQEAYPEAEALFKRVVTIYDKLPDKQRDIWRGNGINNLAVLYGNQANALADNGQIAEANAAYDRMIAMLNEVIPLWSRAFGTGHPNLANPLQSRGEAYSKKQQYDRAEADLREALKIRLQEMPRSQLTAATENNLANALSAQKKYPEAEQLLQSALQIRTELFGTNHPSTARNFDALSRSMPPAATHRPRPIIPARRPAR